MGNSGVQTLEGLYWGLQEGASHRGVVSTSEGGTDTLSTSSLVCLTPHRGLPTAWLCLSPLPGSLPAQASATLSCPSDDTGRQPQGRTEGHGLICTLGRLTSPSCPSTPQCHPKPRTPYGEGTDSWLVTSVWLMLGAALCQVYTVLKHCHGNFP